MLKKPESIWHLPDALEPPSTIDVEASIVEYDDTGFEVKLQTLRAHLNDAWVELVRIDSQNELWVDSEFLLKGGMVNPVASYLTVNRGIDMILGPAVLVVRSSEALGPDADLKRLWARILPGIAKTIRMM